MRFHRTRAGGVRRKLALLLVLVALAIVALPYLAAPFLRDRIVARLEQDLDARATLAELSIGLGGRLRAAGFALDARDGRRIAAAERLDARLDLWRVLFGDLDLDVDLDGFELHLWKQADGRWNVEGLAGSRGSDGSRGSGGKPAGDEGLPALRARLAAERGRVVLHGEGGETALALSFSADLERWETPAPFALTLSVRGPGPAGADAPGGELHVKGSFALEEAGRRGLLGASGELAIELDGLRAAALAPAVSLVLPLEELGGALDGRVDLTLASGLALDGTLALEATDVLVRRSGATPLSLPAVALRGSAQADASGAGRQDLRLEAGQALALHYAGTLAALPAAGGDGGAAGGGRSIEGRLELHTELEELARLARGFLPLAESAAPAGAVHGGFDLRARLDERSRPLSLALAGTLAGERLAARGADGAPLPLEAFAGATLAVEAEADFAAGSLRLGRLQASAGALELSGSAALGGVPGLAAEGAVLSVERSSWDLRADLGALRADLAQLFPSGREELAGRLSARVEARGTAPGKAGESAPVQAKGELAVEGLALVWPVGEHELRWSDPRVDVSFDTLVALGATTRASGKLDLISALLRGGIEGGLERTPAESAPADGTDAPATWRFDDVRGSFRYVPDRLAEVIGPWLPGRLAGSEPQRLEVRLSGSARGFEPQAFLAHTTIDAEAGLGSLTMNGLTLGGELSLHVADGASRLGGDLSANGGKLDVRGGLPIVAREGGAASAPAAFHFSAKDVRAKPELSPLLGHLHPAFAASSALQGNALDGLIQSELELSHAGGLTLETLFAGDPSALFGGLNGKGSFALSQATLRGSPLLVDLLGQLGLDAGRSLDLEPVRFVIEAGRVSYVKPWQWTIDGAKTSFSGSIGLDRTLSMAWSIPVTKRVVDKHGFLSALEGEVLELPIGGSLTSPRLEVSGLLSQLASKAAKKELEKALGEGLGDKLGLGGGKGGAGEAGDDPAQLLQRADELWKAGQKEEAAKLYKTLNSDHKLSLVYVLNRDRIKDRAKYEPR